MADQVKGQVIKQILVAQELPLHTQERAAQAKQGQAAVVALPMVLIRAAVVAVETPILLGELPLVGPVLTAI